MHTAGPLPLDPVPASPALARRWVTRALDGIGCAALSEVVALLVSEVVTNALLHARTPLEVDVRPHGDGVRVEVRDGSPAGPRRKRHSLEGTTGRGLCLVERLADDWGWRPESGGKVVWFDVSQARDPWADLDADDLLAAL
jgi:anti-sigma regulatory factor (Ser/Thr protein kinase)